MRSHTFGKLLVWALILVQSLSLQAALADSGKTFYFALPGNSIGRERTPGDIDDRRSVYHLVVERAVDTVYNPSTPETYGNRDGGAATFTLQFLHGGEVHNYKYWKQTGSSTWVSENFEDVTVDYGSPVAIELETMFDPDGPLGSAYEPILTSTNDFADGGVQEGVFRVVSDKPVRLLLYNVDGPYVDPAVDTFAPAHDLPTDSIDRTLWPHYANGQWSPDATRLYPVNNLGEEYTLNIDVPDRKVVNSQPKASVTVVATRDNTLLSFGASPLMLEGDGDEPIGVPYEVRLNRGQMWTMSADQYRLALLENPSIPAYYIDSAVNLLNGMGIRATKPVSVFVAGGCATVRRSACDQTLLQLIPDRLQGTKYHLPIGPRGWMDAFDIRIVAIEDVNDLTVTIRIPDTTSFTADIVSEQPKWVNGNLDKIGIQEFQLVSPTDSQAGEQHMPAGSVWEVVWSSLPYNAFANLSAERPGIDAVNRRLTIGYIIDAVDFYNGNGESAWRAMLQGENGGELPSGTIMLVPSADLPESLVTIESSAPINVVLSPKPWSNPMPDSFSLTGDGSGAGASGKVSIRPELSGSSPLLNLPGIEYVWDSPACAAGQQIYQGVPAFFYDDYNDNLFSGIATDPAAIQVLPTERWSGFTSVSIPMALWSEYVGDPRPYFSQFLGSVGAHDLPLSPYIMLSCDRDYINSATKKIAVRRTFNIEPQSHPGLLIPASDTGWVDFSQDYSSIVTQSGGSYSPNAFSHIAACSEAFQEAVSGVFNGYWLSSAWGLQALAQPAVFHSIDTDAYRGWLRHSQLIEDDTVVSTVMRLVPFHPIEVDEILWGSGADQEKVFNPYRQVDGTNYDYSDVIQPGDMIPNVPVITYEFAVGEMVNGEFVIDHDAHIMAYAFGTGFYGTYAFAGSLPPEPARDDELTILDQIPVAVGNSIDPATVQFGSVPLVLGEDFRIDEHNGGESVLLDADISAYPIAAGQTKELTYELELRDVVPGSTRLVGESTELEYFRYDPDTNQAEQSVQERGPTSLAFGEGPIDFDVLLVDVQDTAVMTPIEYFTPDEDINVRADIEFDSLLDAFRAVVGNESEFVGDEHLYSGTRVISQSIEGHDRFRVGTVMLDRQSASSTSEFYSSGTATFVLDAERPVEWDSIVIQEGVLQPRYVGGGVEVDASTDLITKVEVRAADSVSQIEAWRDGSPGAPAFIEITTEMIDGVPPTVPRDEDEMDVIDPGEHILDLSASTGLRRSSLLEVRVTLQRGVRDGGTADEHVSPVIESIAVGYKPDGIQVDLDVIDSQGQVVLELLETTIEYGVDVADAPDVVLRDSLLSGELPPNLDYRVRGRLIDDHLGFTFLERHSEPFEIALPEDISGVLATDVSTDRSAYRYGDHVRVFSGLTNLSQTAWTNNLSVLVEVYKKEEGVDPCSSPSSLSSYHTFQSYGVYEIAPYGEDLRELGFHITGDYVPGTYQVVQVVDNEGASSSALLCTIAEFDVLEPITPEISGAMSVSTRELPTDNGATNTIVNYSVVNPSSYLALTGVRIQILAENLSSVQTDEPVLQITDIGMLDIGQAYSMGEVSWTPGATGVYMLKYYAWADQISTGDINDIGNWEQLAIGSVVNTVGGVLEQPWYVAIELEQLPADASSVLGEGDYLGGINERGFVVGGSKNGSGDSTAVTWFDCIMPSDLQAELTASIPGVTISESFASDISDDGTIVGSFEDSYGNIRAYIHSEHVGTYELNMTEPHDSLVPAAVNSLGRDSSVVGWSVESVMNNDVSTGVLWRRVYRLQRSGGVIAVPLPIQIMQEDVVASRLLDINDEGIAVGWCEDENGNFNMLWVDSDDTVHVVDLSNVMMPEGATYSTTDIRLYAITNLENTQSNGETRRVYGSFIDTTSGDEIAFFAYLSIGDSQGEGIDQLILVGEDFGEDYIRPLDATKGGSVVGSMGSSTTYGEAFLWDAQYHQGYTLDELVFNENVSGTLEWDFETATGIMSSADRWIAVYGTHEGTSTAIKAERIPLSTDDLDALHFWIRADTGVVRNASNEVTQWRDLTRGQIKISDADSMNAVGFGPNTTADFEPDCCGANQVVLENSESILVAGVKDDSGVDIADEGTLAIVFTPSWEVFGTDAVVLKLGSSTFLDITINNDGQLQIESGGDTFSLGRVYAGLPVSLIIRQQSGGVAHAWREGGEAVELVGVDHTQWSGFVAVAVSSASTEYQVGYSEVMLFDRALSDQSIGELGEDLTRRYNISSEISSNESAVLWLRSDNIDTSDLHDSPYDDHVETWPDQIGNWGRFEQLDPALAPTYVTNWFEQCIPSVRFSGTEYFDGLGPADILIVFDHSGSMRIQSANSTANQGNVPTPLIADLQYDNGTRVENGTGGLWTRRFTHAREAAADFSDLIYRSENPLGHRIGLMHFDEDENGDDHIRLLDLSHIPDPDGLPSSKFSLYPSVVQSAIRFWASGINGTSDEGSSPFFGTSESWWTLIPDGGTDISGAIRQVDSILHDGSVTDVSRRRAAVFLSDGKPHTNQYGSPTPDGIFSNHVDYGINMALENLDISGIPVYTIGFGLDQMNDADAIEILQRIAQDSGDGARYFDAIDGDSLRESFVELVDEISSVVEQATLSLVFRPSEVPDASSSPAVLLQTGELTGNTPNGLNVYLHDDVLYVGVWWTDPGGGVSYDSMSAPIHEDDGVRQLVITLDGVAAGGIQIDAYLDGNQLLNGAGKSTGSQAFILGNMTLGASADSVVRTDTSSSAQTATGFVGDVFELAIFTESLDGIEIDRLFDWGRDRYGAGTRTDGFAPIAIANGPGVGDDGLFDTDFDGFELVQLDATGTFDPDDFTSSLSYRWYNGESLIGTGPSMSMQMRRGRHKITLEVEDPAGHVSYDRLVVDISRVLYNIKPVDVKFDVGPLQGVGDPLPLELAISPETTSKLKVLGQTPSYQTGRSSTSVKLDGVSYLDLSEAEQEIPAGSVPRTYSVWFETGVTAHDEPTLFVQSDDAGMNRFEVTGNKRRVAYSIDGYTRGVEWSDPADQLPVGWHHLVVVVPRGAVWADQVRMYLNGEELLTKPLDNTGAPGPIFTGSQHLYVGGNPLSPDGLTKHQGGRIDEVGVYTGALTSSEIADLYNDVPIASWGFETSSSTYAYASTQVVPTDLSTLVLSEQFAMINESGRLVLGQKGGASTAGAVFAAPEGNWTIMFKIKPEIMTTDMDPLISDSTGAVLLLLEDTNQAPLLYVATTDNSLPAPGLFDGQEHWITIMSRKGYPGVTDGTFLFVDSDIDFALPLSTSSTMLDGGPITIAGPNDNNGGFEGTIDDLHIFGRPLTETECLQIIEE